MKAKLLNLGCGNKFHKDWVNVDHFPISKKVIRCDILAGLPFEEGSFDGCYSSHVIEHMDTEDALLLLKEIFRILKSGGICRIVVPDYQDCVAEYLRVLERAMKHEYGADLDYKWIVIEMIDQFARTTCGGQMRRYIASAPKNLTYVESRIGTLRVQSFNCKSARGLVNRIISAGWIRIFEKLRIGMARVIISILCGRKYRMLFTEAVFRANGEIHKSAWDGYSLKTLFEQAGFSEVRRCTASESRIEGFEKSGLDFSLDDKKVFRLHSLYMEAKKI
jgi:predicted SAM-dependent methyltransferase